jgi:hypothetical protein
MRGEAGRAGLSKWNLRRRLSRQLFHGGLDSSPRYGRMV